MTSDCEFPRVRLKLLLAEPLAYGANEPASEDNPDDPRYIRITDISERGQLREDTRRSLDPAKAAPYLLRDNDLLLARSGATVGKAFRYRNHWGKACYAGYLIRARVDSLRLDPALLQYFTESNPYWQYVKGTEIQSTIQNVSAERYANLPVPVPPIEDQPTIAAFLDRETAKIDALIAKQEQLIATLQEDRIATITHAVTCGLVGSDLAIDSGIPWLGRVSEGWTVSRFSRHVRISGGQVDPKRPEFATMPLIAPNHIESGTGRLTGIETAEEQGADSGKYMVRAGQVVYSKIRPNLAKATISPIDALCSADMYALEPDAKLLSTRFLLYLLLSQPFTDYVVDSSMRVAMPKVNHESLGAAPIWFPQLNIQLEIVEYLDKRTMKIDQLVAKAVETIRALRQYRAALITDAVTGKIDVREMV